jgi:hypothetical protein
MSCSTFQTTNPPCRTITTIEPDSTLLSTTSSGSTDQSLTESGMVPLEVGTPVVTVNFQTKKASVNYQFEYLYVDTLGLPHAPGTVIPIVLNQTLFGFTVDLAGVPVEEGYILRWRVVVQSLELDAALIDSPENLRVQLLPDLRVQTITFVHQRSNITYGFSELRVENVVDPASTQRIILVQVAKKSLIDFTIGINPPAPTNSVNYFVVARTP